MNIDTDDFVTIAAWVAEISVNSTIVAIRFSEFTEFTTHLEKTQILSFCFALTDVYHDFLANH